MPDPSEELSGVISRAIGASDRNQVFHLSNPQHSHSIPTVFAH